MTVELHFENGIPKYQKYINMEDQQNKTQYQKIKLKQS